MIFETTVVDGFLYVRRRDIDSAPDRNVFIPVQVSSNEASYLAPDPLAASTEAQAGSTALSQNLPFYLERHKQHGNPATLIEHVAPPRILRRKYQGIIESILSANGDWVRIPFDQIVGRNRNMKVQKLHAAAYNRGFRVKTRTDGDNVHVRLRSANDSSIT
jgi:hypothetical protein